MGIYLVDYENVKVEGLNDVARLCDGDRVIVFYTVNADRITFDLHNSINESKADISFLKVEAGGKNALDFQLSTYMGYLAATEKNERFFVVSKDTGFGHMVNFWQQRGISMQRIPSLVNAPKSGAVKTENTELMVKPAADITVRAENQPKRADAKAEARSDKADKQTKAGAEDKQSAPQAVKSDVPELSELITDKNEYKTVKGAIEKYKTKQGINNALQKTFGNTRTSEIYRLIQPFIKDKKGR